MAGSRKARHDTSTERRHTHLRSFDAAELDKKLEELCGEDRHVERYHPCETLGGYGAPLPVEDAYTSVAHIISAWDIDVPDSADARHRKQVAELVIRLNDTEEYSFVLRNCHYQSKRGFHGEGEVDVLGVIVTRKGAFFHNFEVKGTSNGDGRRYGKRQIRRWMNYMHEVHNVPYSRLEGFVVSPKCYDDERRSRK